MTTPINTAHPIYDGVVAQLGFDPITRWRAMAPTIAPPAPKRRKAPLIRRAPAKKTQTQ